MMKRFRIPRKTKKSLGKTLWLYPPDSEGNSLMAHPVDNYEDYSALKRGILNPIPERTNSRIRRKEMHEELDKEVKVSDEMLKAYVDDLIRVDLRISSFNTLCSAMKSKKAIIAYYNFINAYQLFKSGKESYGNIACMSIEWAKKLLKS